MKFYKQLKKYPFTFFIVIAVVAMSCNSDSTTTTSTDTDSSMSNSSENAAKSMKPKGEKPEWAASITNNMQVVIEKMESFGTPSLATLTPAEARKQPTPTDAVKAVMRENNITPPASAVDTSGISIPVAGGMIRARVYTPKNANANLPGIVYYHGGGWVIADLDVYDASAQGLAEQSGAVVVSVHYRQAPEFKFPTAHNDAFAAYQWVLKNGADLKIDTAKIAVAGESAGGNLACNVSIMARDKGIKIPVHQLLVYPVADNDMNSESYVKYANAKPLNKPLMEWFAKHYLPSMSAAADPRISLVNANLKGLPPTTIIAAEIDPLTTEGKLLADKLQAAGVQVDYKLYNGVVHEFFGMAIIIPEAKDAMAKASGNLKNSFR